MKTSASGARIGRAGSRFAAQRGLTLIELMIAMTIGLFITGMVSVLFIAANKSSTYQEATARMQENARFAMSTMSRAIRNSGYRSCGSLATLANVVNGGESTWAYNLATPLKGYEGGSSEFPSQITTSARLPNSDALAVVGVDTVAETGVVLHDLATSRFVTGPNSLKNGAILVVSDCDNIAVFQNTGPGTALQTQLFHALTGASPGNCYGGLGASCSKTQANHTFSPGSTMSPLYASTYYVGPASSGVGNSLWAVMLADNGSVGAAAEVIEGVDDMQIEYGEDTDADGVPNGYAKADAVVTWANVVAVRVSLLMVTLKDNLSSTPQTYDFNGATITATDRKVRRAFTSVINLRNRTQ
ncbi:MAG: PilW family protein [Janthinobacterium lividum]